ncbi:hypothetical protein [Eudoraea chungangensis]|uniref:hypothetical protein n=1 Tax=Eudoraea chungangensis TaxID=1481905 RepID=UPI0023EAF7D8|nr:hypothetical protein [Eudoraea chungangensis]
MRFFKPGTMNWKYIIGEVLLIFIGINLAIWFNDWNASNKTMANKKIAVTKIKEEIQNNLNELQTSRNLNLKIPKAISEYAGFPKNKEGDIEVSSKVMQSFQKEYPDFYVILDSMPIGEDLVLYNGDTQIQLELTALTEIAWETSRNMGIANEFGYECLYDLENMYNIQRLVKKELNKAAEALQSEEIDRLLRVLGFLEQLEEQLETDYKAMLAKIDFCL